MPFDGQLTGRADSRPISDIGLSSLRQTDAPTMRRCLNPVHSWSAGFQPASRCGGRLRPYRLPALWRVGADEFLVDVGAPAWAGRQQELAVLDDRRHCDDVVLPADVVDVDLHHLEVRHDGAEM